MLITEITTRNEKERKKSSIVAISMPLLKTSSKRKVFYVYIFILHLQLQKYGVKKLNYVKTFLCKFENLQ